MRENTYYFTNEQAEMPVKWEKLAGFFDKQEFNYFLISRLIFGSMKLPNKYKLHRYTNRFPIYE